MAQFQIALYRYHNGAEPNSALYEPSSMKMFADRHVPGLFDKILQCIESNNKRATSSKRHQKNLQRTVSVLHILSYFRQVVNLHSSLKSFVGNYSTVWYCNCTLSKCKLIFVTDPKRQACYKKMLGFSFHVTGCQSLVKQSVRCLDAVSHQEPQTCTKKQLKKIMMLFYKIKYMMRCRSV